MNRKLDIVLINPGDRKQVYQDLGKDYSGIEPPFWIAVIAAYLRNSGFGVAVIDANAENIAPEETAARVDRLDPLLAAVIVYGSNPSASTQNMTVAGKICGALKERTRAAVVIGGLHPSALPERTLREEAVDAVIEGEGPLTLAALLRVLRSGNGDYSAVPGIWYKRNGGVGRTPRAPLVADLDRGLPLGAWDLLPMQAYRAHNWHCFDNIYDRSPYGAVYTSLGCPYSCLFCCINAPFGKPGIRYRGPKLVVEEIGTLVERYGVRHLKIIDELFVLNEKHYMAIVDMLNERRYGLNIWAYARVDTVLPRHLDRMKKAGINWLALGIESANPAVRDGATKRMKVSDIASVVRTIRNAGMSIIGNYIFGLPDDTLATMQETLDLAVELNCEYGNFYCAMAYPGSRLYAIALEQGWELPKEWHGYSQLSYETLPLPTKHIGAREVLRFRDDAFHRYFSAAPYLDMVERKFSPAVRKHVEHMTDVRLKRRILGD